TGIGLVPATNLISGIPLSVFWTNLNTGAGTTTGSWLDQLVVSNLTTGQRIYITNVYYDFTSLSNMASGQTRVRKADIALPDGIPGVGHVLFTVVANINNAIAEYNVSGTAENNNVAVTNAVSTLAPYPDLAVTGISVPSAIAAGSVAQISWVVTNQ